LLSKPGYLPALLLKARLEQISGNLDAAEQQARALAAQYPREAAIQQLLGDIAMQRQHYSDAIPAYTRAFELEKNTAHAIGLYHAYSQSGNNAKALAFIQSWVGNHPADPAARGVLARAYIQSEQLDLAQQQYEVLIKQLPNDASIHNDLAYILLQRHQPGALAVAEKAYQLAPSDANVADTLGWALVEAGEVGKGLRYLREAQVRSPNDPEIRDHLDEALKRMGAAK
jgi:predicted Zn-dependent protease